MSLGIGITGNNVVKGSGGGTSDYSQLSNKPKINSIELSGKKTANDLELLGIGDIVDDLGDLSSNKPISARAVNEDVIDYIDQSISDTMNYIMQEDTEETAARIAGDNLINAKIGDLTTLDTPTKTDIVTAVNEAYNWTKVNITPISITYNELGSLSGNYIPGALYRITDYNFTTITTNTRSANHQFDIIVKAIDKRTLLKEARACVHEFLDSEKTVESINVSLLDGEEIGTFTYFEYNGIMHQWKHSSSDISVFTLNRNPTLSDSLYDSSEINSTYGISKINYEEEYFTKYHCRLDQWKIWYDIRPNNDMYSWVNESAHGVIYRMIDERGNEGPYDFKNLQYRNSTEPENSNEAWEYTFNCYNSNSPNTDMSVVYNSYNTHDSLFHSNIIKSTLNTTNSRINFYVLPFIVFRGALNGYNEFNCYNNYIGYNCKNIILDGKWTGIPGYDMYIEGEAHDITLKGSNQGKIGFGVSGVEMNWGAWFEIGSYSENITIDDAYSFSIGRECANIELYYENYNIRIGDSCGQIYIGEYSENIIIENSCNDIFIDDDCSNIHIGVGCVHMGINATQVTVFSCENYDIDNYSSDSHALYVNNSKIS